MKSRLPVTALTAILIWQLSFWRFAEAQKTACLPNDVFTAFGGGSNNVQDIAISAYERDNEIQRVLFASTLVSNTDSQILTNFVTYIDMLSCEVYFQIKEESGAFDFGILVAAQPPLDFKDLYGERLYFLGSRSHPDKNSDYNHQIVVKEFSIKTGSFNQLVFDFCCGIINDSAQLTYHESKREVYFQGQRGLVIINFDKSEVKQVLVAANYQIQASVYKYEKLFYFFGNQNKSPDVILLSSKFQWNGWDSQPSYLQRNHDYISQNDKYPASLKAKIATKDQFDYETVTGLCFKSELSDAFKLGAIASERGFYWWQEDSIRGCLDIDIDLQGDAGVNVNYLVLQKQTNQIWVFSIRFTFGSDTTQRKSYTAASQSFSEINDMDFTNFKVHKGIGPFNWYLGFHGNMRQNIRYGEAEIGFIVSTQGQNRNTKFFYQSNFYSQIETQVRTYGSSTSISSLSSANGNTQPILEGTTINFNQTQAVRTLNDWIYKFCVDQDFQVKRVDLQIPANNDTYLELPYSDILFDIAGSRQEQLEANPWYKTCYPRVEVNPDRENSIEVKEVKPIPDNLVVINVTEKVKQRVLVQRVALMNQYQPNSFYFYMLNQLTPEEDQAQKYFIEVKNRAPYLDPPPQRVSFIRVGQRADKFVWETTYLKDDDGDGIYASFRNYPDFLIPKYNNEFLFTSRKIEKSDEGLYKIDYILIDDAELNGLQPAFNVYQLIVIVTLSGYIEEEPEIVRQEDTMTDGSLVDESESDSAFIEWVEFTPIAERPPKVNVTPINAKGEFQINFSKPLRIPENFDELSRDSTYFFGLLSAKLEAQAERERIAARRGFARLLQGNWQGFSDYEGEDISEEDEEEEVELEERQQVVLYRPLIEVSLEPGFTQETSETELALLNQPIEWEITEFASYKIAIKINFSQPKIVSQIQGAPDKMKVVLNLEDFADPYGLRVYNGTTIEKFLPTQIADEFQLLILEQLSEISLYTILGLLFCCYLTFNLSKSSLVLVWILFNSLQMISHLPLLAINAPANLGFFNQQLALLGRLQLIIVGYGSDFLFGYLFDFEQTPAYSVQFEQVGYTSLYAIPNLGTIMILVVLFVPVFTAVYTVLLFGSRCSIFIEHYYWIAKNNFFWGFFQRFNTITYLVFVVSGLISIQNVSLENWSHALQLAIVLYIAAVFFTMPFVTLVFYALKYPQLDEKEFKMRWGSVYAGHKSGDLKTRYSVIWASWFYLRRLLFAILVVFLKDKMVLQLDLMIGLNLINGMMLCICKPYEDKAAFRLELLGEITLLVLCYHMMAFTGLVPQNWMRFAFGWSYICLLLSSFLIHAVYMAFKAITDARHMMRRKIYLYKQKQIMLAFIKEMSKPNMIFVSAPKILNQSQVLPQNDIEKIPTDRDDSQRIALKEKLDVVMEEEEKEEPKNTFKERNLSSSGEGGKNNSNYYASAYGGELQGTDDRGDNFEIGNFGGHGGMNSESDDNENSQQALPAIGMQKKNLAGINDMLRTTHMGLTWQAAAPTEFKYDADQKDKQNLMMSSQEEVQSNLSSNKLLTQNKSNIAVDNQMDEFPQKKNSSMEYNSSSTIKLGDATTKLDKHVNVSPDPISYSVAMPSPELVNAVQTGQVAIVNDSDGKKQFTSVAKNSQEKLEVSENDIEEVGDTSRNGLGENASGRVEMATLDKSDADRSASDTLTPRVQMKDIEAPDAFYPVAKSVKNQKKSTNAPDAQIFESNKQAGFEDEHIADLNEGMNLRESFGNIQKAPKNVFTTPGRESHVPTAQWSMAGSAQKNYNVTVLGQGLAARHVEDAQFQGNILRESKEAKRNTRTIRQTAANMFLMAEDSADKGISSDSSLDMGPMPVRSSANFNNANQQSDEGQGLPNIFTKVDDGKGYAGGDDDEVVQTEDNPFALAEGVDAKPKEKSKKSKISTFFNSFYKTASEKKADALREAQDQQEEERERLSSRQKSSDNGASAFGFSKPEGVGAVSERSEEESHVDSSDDDGFK